MSIGVGILVFLVSLIALVAEFFLYMILGVGAAFSSGGVGALTGLAFFFVGLMLLTGTAGVVYPICAVIATIGKNKKLGNVLFLSLMGLVGAGYLILVPISVSRQSAGKAGSTAQAEQTPTFQAAQASARAAVSGTSATPRTNDAEALKRKYISESLILKDIRVDKGYGQFDVPGYSTPKRGVFGTIKNTGDRTLKRVRMAVYFLDAGGARVGEKELTIMSSESIMNADPPLKPNYSKDFGYILEDDASKEWAGKVEVEISQVEFAE